MKRKQSLSSFLKEKRIAADLSQADVAEKFGFKSAQFVSNWERGLSNPPIAMAKKLMGYYKVSVDEFYEHFLNDTIVRETQKLQKAFGKIVS